MQFSNKFYDAMKWICLVALPALSTFLGAILPVLNVPTSTTTTILTIISALITFIGMLIGISTATYNKTNVSSEQ